MNISPGRETDASTAAHGQGVLIHYHPPGQVRNLILRYNKKKTGRFLRQASRPMPQCPASEETHMAMTEAQYSAISEMEPKEGSLPSCAEHLYHLIERGPSPRYSTAPQSIRH